MRFYGVLWVGNLEVQLGRYTGLKIFWRNRRLTKDSKPATYLAAFVCLLVFVTFVTLFL